uniref:Uncharacterized protein n=1 Tax=Eutreptiella gymnastica TaxID=73025 RepID=A0A7S1JDJ5_9EUGL
MAMDGPRGLNTVRGLEAQADGSSMLHSIHAVPFEMNPNLNLDPDPSTNPTQAGPQCTETPQSSGLLTKYLRDIVGASALVNPKFEHKVSTLLRPVVEHQGNRPPEDYTIKPFNWSNPHQRMAFSGIALAAEGTMKKEKDPNA